VREKLQLPTTATYGEGRWRLDLGFYTWMCHVNRGDALAVWDFALYARLL
jgi:hypothetical protein